MDLSVATSWSVQRILGQGLFLGLLCNFVNFFNTLILNLKRD